MVKWKSIINPNHPEALISWNYLTGKKVIPCMNFPCGYWWSDRLPSGWLRVFWHTIFGEHYEPIQRLLFCAACGQSGRPADWMGQPSQEAVQDTYSVYRGYAGECGRIPTAFHKYPQKDRSLKKVQINIAERGLESTTIRDFCQVPSRNL